MMMACSYEQDLTTWPSRYYGRTRHVDIAKLYHTILLQSQLPMTPDDVHQHCSRPQRRVHFAKDEPTIYEYEPEDDDDDDDDGNDHACHNTAYREHDSVTPLSFSDISVAYMNEESLPGTTTVYGKNAARKTALMRRVDLRPVLNHDYYKAKPDPNSTTHTLPMPSIDPSQKALPSKPSITVEESMRPPVFSPPFTGGVVRRRTSPWLVQKTSTSFAALRRKVL